MLIIYRRDSISISQHLPQNILGNNLYVWYGYSKHTHLQNNLIIDAKRIKAEMVHDLKRFDHSIVKCDETDYIGSLLEIGKKVFENAVGTENRTIEYVLLEDCYGDKIYVSNQNSKVIIPFYVSGESISVCFHNEYRAKFYGKAVTHHYLTMKDYDNLLFQDCILDISLNFKNLPANFIISTVDAGSGFIVSRSRYFNEKVVFTISCVEHFEHCINNTPELGKCANLHGHSYCCDISVLCSIKNSMCPNFIFQLENMFHLFLREAFQNEYLTTTCENVALYVDERMKMTYTVLRICLKETDNIMAVIEH